MDPDVFHYSVLIAFAISIFLITKAILEKFNFMRNQILVSALITIISIPLLHKISFLIWFVSIYLFMPGHFFNKDEWNDDKEHRYKMAKSLVYGKALKRKGKNEIQELLGKPESVPLDSIWVYYLGIRPGIIVDPDILKIYFRDSVAIRVVQVCEGKGDCEESVF